jgi:geranylgeranylglycerol-phosphate geranylgeranyltransferase
MAEYLRLTRPPNAFLMFVAVLVGVVFSEQRNFQTLHILLAFLTAYGLTGSSMALNDYFDREVDAVNNPTRPIPSGGVSPGSAVALSAVLAALGLASAALISPQSLIVASAAFAAASAYNWKLKKTGLAGNMVVSFTVVAPFLYGSVISDGVVSGRVGVFALLAFLANTGREVIKGMTDVEGDARRNVMTIARVRGLQAAARLGAALYLAAVALSPLPYLLGVAGPLYLPAVSLADAGFVYSCFKLLKNPDPETARRQKNLTLIWMLTALVSFLLGGLY